VSTVHVIVPAGIDDVALVSGGNVYDRRVIDGLRALGVDVHEHHLVGTWPHPGPADLAALSSLVDGIEDRGLLLIDGIIASVAPEVLVPAGARLRLVPLVHMLLGAGLPDTVVPDAVRRELAVLRAAASVVVTSAWTRDLVVEHHGVRTDRVTVAAPGTDAARVSPGSTSGSRLVSVGAVSRAKGHDVLVDALGAIADLDWTCTVVGSTGRDPDLVDDLAKQVARAGLADRVTFTGVLTGDALDDVLAASDLLVHPSRGETYGMVVAEALARGIPVVATTAGGLSTTLGEDADGRPGILVPPGDPEALATALRAWLRRVDLRSVLRARALERRRTLVAWDATAATVARALEAVTR
jgi:glycosyltransferase involved in cell wall biosynthesis